MVTKKAKGTPEAAAVQPPSLEAQQQMLELARQIQQGSRDESLKRCCLRAMEGILASGRFDLSSILKPETTIVVDIVNMAMILGNELQGRFDKFQSSMVMFAPPPPPAPISEAPAAAAPEAAPKPTE